ncbi:DUF6390 family protein [Patescibacteria group bacterium]
MLSEFNRRGILRCARYSFMPNNLSLCGPNKNKDLFEYCREQKIDKGLEEILKKFQTLYPYLKLIARCSNIKNPFDEKVIEAYWIGNRLLENITKIRLYNHLIDNHKKKAINKISLGAKPHHSFHVLNVWNKIDDLSLADLCKISWGKIVKIDGSYLEVKYRPLVFENNRLKLGELINHKVLREINNSSFMDDFQIGQWVSFHWNFVCEILNDIQVKNLEKYTKESISLCTI